MQAAQVAQQSGGDLFQTQYTGSNLGGPTYSSHPIDPAALGGFTVRLGGNAAASPEWGGSPLLQGGVNYSPSSETFSPTFNPTLISQQISPPTFPTITPMEMTPMGPPSFNHPAPNYPSVPGVNFAPIAAPERSSFQGTPVNSPISFMPQFGGVGGAPAMAGGNGPLLPGAVSNNIPMGMDVGGGAAMAGGVGGGPSPDTMMIGGPHGGMSVPMGGGMPMGIVNAPMVGAMPPNAMASLPNGMRSDAMAMATPNGAPLRNLDGSIAPQGRAAAPEAARAIAAALAAPRIAPQRPNIGQRYKEMDQAAKQEDNKKHNLNEYLDALDQVRPAAEQQSAAAIAPEQDINAMEVAQMGAMWNRSLSFVRNLRHATIPLFNIDARMQAINGLVQRMPKQSGMTRTAHFLDAILGAGASFGGAAQALSVDPAYAKAEQIVLSQAQQAAEMLPHAITESNQHGDRYQKAVEKAYDIENKRLDEQIKLENAGYSMLRLKLNAVVREDNIQATSAWHAANNERIKWYNAERARIAQQKADQTNAYHEGLINNGARRADAAMAQAGAAQTRAATGQGNLAFRTNKELFAERNAAGKAGIETEKVRLRNAQEERLREQLRRQWPGAEIGAAPTLPPMQQFIPEPVQFAGP